MKPKTIVTLPKPIYAGGLSQREHAIRQAQDWQQAWMREHPSADGVSVPDQTYLVVRDLLTALLAPAKRVAYTRR